MLLELCDAKHLCIANTCFRKSNKKKIAYGSGCYKSKIAFCIMGKVDHMFLKNIIVITGELQHNLVIVVISKKKKKENRKCSKIKR